MKRKILFLITKATWGGAQKYVFDLATNLPREEFAPVVAFGEAGLLAEKLASAGIETLRVTSLARDVAIISDIRSFFEIWRILEKIRPDVLHLNSSKAAALGALAGRLCGVPKIIFTVHGWPFKENRNVLERGLIRLISWFTPLLSHAVVVVSKTDEDIGGQMWLVEKKISYIPIGIEPPQFLSRKEASAALSITSASPRIVTIAELTPNKGIRYAIEAVAMLKKRGVNVSYTIIGDGEERGMLEKLTREKDVADRVLFKGFVPNAPKYLKTFDVFILPSIKEGMPYVLLEAASAGLPIIATDVVKAEVSDLPNIHFVPPKDPRALADAVEKLVHNLPTGKPSKVGSFAEMLKKTLALYR